MDDRNQMSVEELILKLAIDGKFSICEMEAKKFLHTFFSGLYKQLKENDEIVLGELGGEFYSIKRTPTIQEAQDILDRSKMIVSQGTEENNFKVFFVKKKEEE